MSMRLSGLVVAATLMGGPAAAQNLLPGYLRSGPHLTGRRGGDRRRQPSLRNDLGVCLRRHGGPAAVERVRSGLAARPALDELHADHELGGRSHGRRVRP